MSRTAGVARWKPCSRMYHSVMRIVSLCPSLTELVFDLGLGSVFMVLVFLSFRTKEIHFISWELFLIGGILLVLYVFSPMSGGIQSSYVDRRFLLPSAGVREQ